MPLIPTYTELGLLLAWHRHANNVTFDCQYTESLYNDFIKWSQLDPDRHAKLITPQLWIEEFAEFDSAYPDWVADQEKEDN